LLRAILSIQSGDHGMAPLRAPTALHAGLQGYYFDGGCYPRGGGHAIPEAFVRQIRLHGGEVALRTEVDRILIDEDAVVGVRLIDGREVRADIVVSNADPGVTWAGSFRQSMWVGDCSAGSAAYDIRFPPSVSSWPSTWTCGRPVSIRAMSGTARRPISTPSTPSPIAAH
jgi:hypothetical protein